MIVEGGDFTIRGGASDSGTPYPRVEVTWLAGELRVPFIRLLDGAGGSVRNYDPEAQQAGRRSVDAARPCGADEAPLVDVKPTGTPGSFDLPQAARLLGGAAGGRRTRWRPEMAKGNLLAQVPVVAAVLGSVAGLPAVHVGDCHFSVMTKTAETFVGGPPMVAQALGLKVTKQQLGDWTVQAKTSGVVHNVAERRGRRLRPDQALPLLPAVERLAAAAVGRAGRRSQPARREPALGHPEAAHGGLRGAQDHRGGGGPRLDVRDLAALRPRAW